MTTNVLSIIHFPVFGGPGNRNSLVAAALQPRGYDTTIVIPAEPGNSAARFVERGISPVQIPLHRLRAVRNPKVHAEYLSSAPREVRAIRRLIRDREIDVVQINGAHNPHGAMAARLENVPIVWQLLDTYAPAAFLKVMMPLVRRWSDVIMTNGMTVAALHPGILDFEGPLISFGPCIPTGRFTANSAVARASRSELGFEPDELVVGTVNNLNPMKGHLTFIRAAAALRRKQPARFLILGAEHHPDYTAELQAEAQRLGLQVGRDLVIRDAGPRVHELAQAIDVFWLTSEPRSEGMSTSLAEAQALGIPVIATRTGAVHECMRHGETGFLVAPHDIDAIVTATETLTSDRALYERFSASGVKHVTENFSVRATADRHAEAYELALRHGGSGATQLVPPGVSRPADGSVSDRSPTRR